MPDFRFKKAATAIRVRVFRPIRVSLMFNTNENNRSIAEFVQAQWKQNLGITIPLKSQEFKTFLKDRHEVAV